MEETHVGKLFMPNGVKYFHDPLTVICNFRSGKLHSKYQPNFIEDGLEAVWCYVKKATELPRVHSLTVDACAQVDIILDDQYICFLDRPDSILLSDVWSAKHKKRRLTSRDEERTHPVPHSWKESVMSTWKKPHHQ